MAGPLPDSADNEGPQHSVSRRDFSRLGLFAGGVALTAPTIRTISFAGKVVGSVTPVGPEGAVKSPAGAGANQNPASTAPAAVSSGTLPFTGGEIGRLTLAGAGAVAIGSAMASAGTPREPEGLADEDQLLADEHGGA